MADGRGGARVGAGRKSGGEAVDVAVRQGEVATRTRKLEVETRLKELRLQVESRKYLPREAFREATATLLAELAHGLRGIPDSLERRFALAPEVLEQVESTIDEALLSIANGMELFVQVSDTDGGTS